MLDQAEQRYINVFSTVDRHRSDLMLVLERDLLLGDVEDADYFLAARQRLRLPTFGERLGVEFSVHDHACGRGEEDAVERASFADRDDAIVSHRV
jgi:hypothetical protein